MAKKTQKAQATKGNEKSKKGNGGAVAVFAIILALVVAIGIGSKLFRNWDVKAWFNHWGNGSSEQSEPFDPDDEQGDTFDPAPGETLGDMIVPGEVQGDGITLKSEKLDPGDYKKYDISSQVESAYLITVTTETEGEIEWNLESAARSFWWENGFADHVQILSADSSLRDLDTDKSARGNAVILTCLQAFEEPFMIHAIARNDENCDAYMWVWYAFKSEVGQPSEEGGMILPAEVQGNGITLKSVNISPNDYTEYGIPGNAESAYLINAIIENDNEIDGPSKLILTSEGNTGIGGAEQKLFGMIDVNGNVWGYYIEGRGFVVYCLKPFEQPILITVTAEHDPEIQVSILVSYLAK